MTTCASCGAEIRWVTLVGSRVRIPLDAKPSPQGNVVVVGNYARVVALPADRVVAPLYLSHFATCPHAAHIGAGGRWREHHPRPEARLRGRATLGV